MGRREYKIWKSDQLIVLMLFAAKSGIDPSGCVRLAEHVKLHCPHLEFSGLMTIGMPDYTSTPENFKVMNSVALKRRMKGFS